LRIHYSHLLNKYSNICLDNLIFGVLVGKMVTKGFLRPPLLMLGIQPYRKSTIGKKKHLQ